MAHTEVYSKKELKEIEKNTHTTEFVFEGGIFIDQKDKDGNLLLREELTPETYKLILQMLQSVLKEYLANTKK